MDLTRFAIERNRVFMTMLVIVLIAGASSYLGMPRSEDPGFIIRTALVQTIFPGASPERVEMLVTDKLEKVIQEIPELDFVSSQTKAGVSLVFVNVREEYTDVRPIWDNLRRKVERARGDLPEDVIGPIVNDEFGDVFGSLIAVTGDGFNYRELKEIADEVRDELLLIDDAAKVEIVGVQEERVFVVFENARLAELGMSPVQLQVALQERNIVLPGGDVTSEYEKIVLEPTGNFESLDELRKSIVSLPQSNAMVRLEDILTIERGYVDPPEVMARFNGEPALMLAVSLREGGNILRLGEGIEDVMRRAQRVYPVGVDFELLNFQPRDVEDKINAFVRNLVQAVVFVAAIMLLFLGLRTGLIVASLIPATILASFLVMSVLDIGLDQMSLAALIIALGMLVDNAIVMSESIMVQAGRGKPVVQAALDSARELRIPLLTSSLTTAAAFLPIFLSESNTGEYTAPLFKVVTITLLCSWVIALTLIPVLCVLFLKVKESDEGPGRIMTGFYCVYDAGLRFALRNRTLTLIGVVAVFAMALFGLTRVPSIFYPPSDRATFTVELDLPVGSPIERTAEVTGAIEAFIAERLPEAQGDQPGLVNMGTFIGQGPPRFYLSLDQKQRSPNYSYILVNTDAVTLMTRELFGSIEAFVGGNYPDANVTIRPMSLGPPAWPPVQIRISGREVDEVFAIVEDVKARLREVPGARQITDNWGPRSKKVIVEIDENRARLAGITNRDVAVSMKTYLTGLATTEFREDDELIPVVLRSRADQRTDPNRIATMNIYSQATGQSVPLGQIAYPRLEWQPGVIERRNRLRTVSVEALLEPGYTVPDVLNVMEPWLEEQAPAWPFGYYWEFGGEAETSGKANAAIAEKLPIAILVIVLLLTGQFNSLRRPLIIMLTIPLALIGVTIGLLVARSYFGFMTLLGVISLSGIVINNAIVLLDRIRIEIDENGLPPDQAVLTAARQRARPILLTTATTVAGLLPLWFGGGPMWEPMAIAIIFGLIFATVLTLGVVPVLYSVFFRVKFA
ncbi:MAG: efflux RND transporter permease subunit [Gammaproteobacteria bacterium]|nr:efflux RND transporter permease subunit [Gammaproteobacteria bacterium]